MNEKFQNLIVLPKHVYLEMIKKIEYEQKLSELDKKIKHILLKNLPDFDKWNLYKKELLNFANTNRIIRMHRNNNDIKEKKSLQTIDGQTQTNEFTGIKVPFMKFNTTNNQKNTSPVFEFNATTTNKKMSNNTNHLKRNVKENEEKHHSIPSKKHINESSVTEEYFSNSNDLEDYNNSPKKNFEQQMSVDEQELEMTLFDEAIKELEPEKSSHVIKNRDSLGKPFREFIDRNTGAKVYIDVEEAKKNLYNKMYEEEDNHLNISSSKESQQLHHSTPLPNNKKKSSTTSTASVASNLKKKKTEEVSSPKRPVELGRIKRKKNILPPKHYNFRSRKVAQSLMNKKEIAEAEITRKKGGRKTKLPWTNI